MSAPAIKTSENAGSTGPCGAKSERRLLFTCRDCSTANPEQAQARSRPIWSMSRMTVSNLRTCGCG